MRAPYHEGKWGHSMTGAETLDVARDAIWTIVVVSSPLMIVGLVVGVVVSLFQALTQIQEQTLARRMQRRAHLQQHHRNRQRRHRALVVRYLWSGPALRKHHGHQLPALLGVERAEVLRREYELHPACDRG